MIDEQNNLETTPENQATTVDNTDPLSNSNSENQTESYSVETSVGSTAQESSGTNQVSAINEEISDREVSQESNDELVANFQAEIVLLNKQLEEIRQQNENVKTQYARLAADLDNIRKRHAKEKENLEQQVKKSALVELLPVVDNFERARTQIKPDSEGEKIIHNSYQGVYKSLVDSLKRLGVSAMRPEGQLFDPNFHEAMLREATDEHPEGTVLEQLMRGYLLGDQVLRHAMVKVAVPKDPVITSEGETREEEKLDLSEN